MRNMALLQILGTHLSIVRCCWMLSRCTLSFFLFSYTWTIPVSYTDSVEEEFEAITNYHWLYDTEGEHSTATQCSLKSPCSVSTVYKEI